MARILVIDDEGSVRLAIRKLLEGSGHEVTEANSGKSGIELYRQDPSDAVVTDIFMPGKDGLDVIRDLREDFPDVKIIAITGEGSTGEVDLLTPARMLGARRTLTKDTLMKTLPDAIKELLGRDR